MNTKQILKEWRSFLSESVKEIFSKEDIGKEVKYFPCCEECKKLKSLKNMKQPRTGKISGVNGNDIQIGDRKENTIFVDKKMVPQCCVKKI